jgi:hypothetical protein
VLFCERLNAHRVLLMIVPYCIRLRIYVQNYIYFVTISACKILICPFRAHISTHSLSPRALPGAMIIWPFRPKKNTSGAVRGYDKLAFQAKKNTPGAG